MKIQALLDSNNEAEYGVEYKAHLLEMYKTYIEMADRISSRRQSYNNYFMTINTVLVSLVSYLHLGIKTDNYFYFLIALSGMILCFIWFRMIKSYKGLNSGKFKIVHLLEKKLPVSPYDAEWEAVGRGKDHSLYHSLTHVEMFVPWVFLGLYFMVFIMSFF